VIVQLVSANSLNGAIRHCYELTVELARHGQPVLLVHKPGAWIASNSFPSNVEFLETSFRRTPYELSRVARELRTRGVELIHSHLSSANFFGVLLARFFGFRSVATCHMTHFQPHWWWNDRVICPSQATASFQRFVNFVPSRRLDVIHYPLNQNNFQPTRDAANVRNSLNVPENRFLIGVVGEVSFRKAPHVLLESLPALIQAGHLPHVFFAGRVAGDYQQFFNDRIRQLNLESVVSVLGQRRDIPDLVNAADCICLSSTREVTPMALLEAMSLGKPTVATRVGGIAECIRDGVDGFLVKPNSPLDLAQRLQQLAADEQLRQKMGQNAIARIEDSFSVRAVIPQILACYEQTLSRKQKVA
jgi:glycosyltransferase involved in cell wall biosynthesis